MSNHKYGLDFESELKKILNDEGITTLSLSYTETADLITISNKVRIIECKTVKNLPKFVIKNKEQYLRLKLLADKGYSVYFAVKYHFGRGSRNIIKFYYLNHHFNYSINEGYTLEEFIAHAHDTNVWDYYLNIAPQFTKRIK